MAWSGTLKSGGGGLSDLIECKSGRCLGSTVNIPLKYPGFPEWHVLQAVMGMEEDGGHPPAILPEGGEH